MWPSSLSSTPPSSSSSSSTAWNPPPPPSRPVAPTTRQQQQAHPPSAPANIAPLRALPTTARASLVNGPGETIPTFSRRFPAPRQFDVVMLVPSDSGPQAPPGDREATAPLGGPMIQPREVTSNHNQQIKSPGPSAALHAPPRSAVPAITTMTLDRFLEQEAQKVKGKQTAESGAVLMNRPSNASGNRHSMTSFATFPRLPVWSSVASTQPRSDHHTSLPVEPSGNTSRVSSISETATARLVREQSNSGPEPTLTTISTAAASTIARKPTIQDMEKQIAVTVAEMVNETSLWPLSDSTPSSLSSRRESVSTLSRGFTRETMQAGAARTTTAHRAVEIVADGDIQSFSGSIGGMEAHRTATMYSLSSSAASDTPKEPPQPPSRDHGPQPPPPAQSSDDTAQRVPSERPPSVAPPPDQSKTSGSEVASLPVQTKAQTPPLTPPPSAGPTPPPRLSTPTNIPEPHCPPAAQVPATPMPTPSPRQSYRPAPPPYPPPGMAPTAPLAASPPPPPPPPTTTTTTTPPLPTSEEARVMISVVDQLLLLDRCVDQMTGHLSAVDALVIAAGRRPAARSGGGAGGGVGDGAALGAGGVGGGGDAGGIVPAAKDGDSTPPAQSAGPTGQPPLPPSTDAINTYVAERFAAVDRKVQNLSGALRALGEAFASAERDRTAAVGEPAELAAEVRLEDVSRGVARVGAFLEKMDLVLEEVRKVAEMAGILIESSRAEGN